MNWEDDIIEALLSKYVKSNQVVAFGTSEISEKFLKNVAMKIESENFIIEIAPSSLDLASIAASLGLKIANIDEKEVDVAIEFASCADEDFTFIKKDTSSLVRDKMIAQSAIEMLVVCAEENFKKSVHGVIPFEIAPFGWKRTLTQLDELGEAKIREFRNDFFKTEGGNYIIDVDIDDVYSLDDIEYETKDIPGVIETGLFIGYADRVLLHNGKISVKSRMDFSKQ